MKRLVFITILAVFLSGGMFAYLASLDFDTDAGGVAYEKRYEAMLPRAQGGDGAAQLAVAEQLYWGLGVEQDVKEATRWYARAAARGLPEAQYRLGRLHERGEGVRTNYFEAARWYQKAAQLGKHAEAQYALGNLYFKGRGVGHDYGAAIDWYRRAAQQGHPAAQYLLGGMYKEGWGLKKDYVEAYKWFTSPSRKPPKRWR